MNKIIISLLMMVLMSSVAFAVTRSISATTVTYTAGTSFNTGIAKAYWAVEDTISGCALDSVSKTSCGSNCEYSIISGKIRLVVFPPSEAGIAIGNSKSITLSGTGTGCTLSGNGVEAYGVAGSSVSMGTSSLNLEVACCESDYDCSNFITWLELDQYITAWALGTQVCGHAISWTHVDTEITTWALQ